MDNHNNSGELSNDFEQELHNSIYLRQNELAEKSITLQILHNHLKANQKLCEEKQAVLGKEMKALDEIHSKVWDLQNRICNQVWDFTMKHDQNEIICKYPNLSLDCHVLCECDRRTDVMFEENIELEKLTMDIRNLETNLKNVNCQSLEAEWKVAEKELQMYEKESQENESLRKEILASEERISNLRLKIGVRYKQMENSSLKSLTNNPMSKMNFSNLAKLNTLGNASLSSAPELNCHPSKNMCSTSNTSLNYGGGFIRASTYLSTSEQAASYQNTTYETIATGAVSDEKPPAPINPLRKKFVPKTKSNITRRR